MLPGMLRPMKKCQSDMNSYDCGKHLHRRGPNDLGWPKMKMGTFSTDLWTNLRLNEPLPYETCAPSEARLPNNRLSVEVLVT
jgi:hypothetical protein